jgi:putative ABC transport system ATP-binding protein
MPVVSAGIFVMQDPKQTLVADRPNPTNAGAGCVLQAIDVSKRYDAGADPVHALREVSISVQRGEFVVIMGASGSGKSTLLHLLGGLDKPTSGTILVEGRDLGRMPDRERTLFRRRRLGIVFQAYNLLPTLSAAENIALPALLDCADQQETERKAFALLERVDLAHRSTHRPQALSGGEQQRVAIARALMNDPALLLADEPTGNLDTEHGAAIWRLLSSLVHDGGCTVVAVTHEADSAAFADRVVVLKDGRVAGEVPSGGEDHASLVATRYRELVG